MFTGARWLAVAGVALVLVVAPLATKAIPADDSNVSAARLYDEVMASDDFGWSGEVSSIGSVQVPLTGSTFGGVSRLLGEQTNLRVWWRGADSWRIDRIRTTGESDLIRRGGLTVRWNYEDNKVSFTPYSPVRLPDDIDVVPVSLARLLLSGSHDSELSRLPARRVAGRDAVGLRLVPSDKRSTIKHVDVWADEASGLPLAVKVYGAARTAILSTALTSLTRTRPSLDVVNFKPSRSLHFSRGVALDAAAGANAFAPFRPPSTVAGLARRGQVKDLGAVGIYGRGPTAVIAVPLRESVAHGLRDQLRSSPSARDTGPGVALEVGPLSVLLERVRNANFLLVGTVTPDTLLKAADDLASGVVRTQ